MCQCEKIQDGSVTSSERRDVVSMSTNRCANSLCQFELRFYNKKHSCRCCSRYFCCSSNGGGCGYILQNGQYRHPICKECYENFLDD